MRSTLIICLMVVVSSIFGQNVYDPDRHNTSYNAGWISCEAKVSPNSERGLSYWIMYDLKEIYKLGKIHLWNTNVPGFEGIGLKEYVIDYSLDGQYWQSWGQANAALASASGYYTGDQGPDLEGLEARYLLITAVSNHGGDCVGFSEIRIESLGLATNTYEIDELEGSIIAMPSIFQKQTTIVSSIPPGNYEYRLTDLSGKVIIQESLINTEDKLEIKLDGDQLVQGIYLFTITDGQKLKTIKIEKINP